MLHFPVLVSIRFASDTAYQLIPTLVHASAGTLHAERRHAHTTADFSVLCMQSGRLRTYGCTPHSDTCYELIIVYTTRKIQTQLKSAVFQ